MTPRHSGTVRQCCSVLLLVLVVSPLTAPFSTFDLTDLVGGPAPTTGTVVHSKTSPDQPVSSVAGRVTFQILGESIAAAVAAVQAPAHRRHAFPIPLRI